MVIAKSSEATRSVVPNLVVGFLVGANPLTILTTESLLSCGGESIQFPKRPIPKSKKREAVKPQVGAFGWPPEERGGV